MERPLLRLLQPDEPHVCVMNEGEERREGGREGGSKKGHWLSSASSEVCHVIFS